MLNTIKISAVFDRKHVATRPTSKNPVKGLVQLSVTINGERKFLSTGIKVYLGQFAGEQIVSRPDAQELSDMLTNQIRAVIEVVNRCNSEGDIFSWPMLDSMKVKRNGTGTGWTDWIQTEMDSRRLAASTLIHHRTVLQFLKDQGVTDFCQLTVGTIRNLDRELHSRKVNGRPMMQTSIYNYHKIIKSYIRRAISAGLIKNNPYLDFKTEKGEYNPREVLTMEEIHRIEKVESRSLHVQHVRDLFLLQIWTGLCFTDLMAADFHNIVDDTLSGQRVKTGGYYTTIILPQAKAILERYSYNIPHLPYDNYRRVLVELLDILGIHKKISTHNGRHTFATTVALGNGVPVEILQKMMGHKSIQTTMIYAKVQRPMVQEQADRLSKLAL